MLEKRKPIPLPAVALFIGARPNLGEFIKITDSQHFPVCNVWDLSLGSSVKVEVKKPEAPKKLAVVEPALKAKESNHTAAPPEPKK